MSSDIDDQWLYGSAGTVPSPVKTKEQVVIKENGNGSVPDRPLTPTLDDVELALNAPPSLPAVSKIVSMAPDLQPKQLPPEGMETEGGGAEQEGEGEAEEGDSDSDDDDVQITIGDITTAPSATYNRTPSYTRMGAGTAGGGAASVKKIDVDAIPQIGGQSLLDYDPEAAEKPWKLPGSDISDYFNYGFTEESWKLYCEKQRKMRGEVNQLNKIAVQSEKRNFFADKNIHSMAIPPPPTILGFPPPIHHHHHPLPPPPFMPPPGGIQVTTPQLAGDSSQTETPEQTDPTTSTAGAAPSDNASDGRATPTMDAPPSTTKLPLLPPPTLPPASLPSMPPRGLPPPFGMPPPNFNAMPPPGQDNIAAAMAAMFGGGIRPPDPLGNLPPPPPHLHPNLPPFPPHGFPTPEGIMPPPFPGMPPHFPIPGGDHGPMMDDRLPPDMGRLLSQFPWDPSMGPPPPELLEAFAHRDQHRGSRSRSRSSSYSRSRSRSRSSSYDDRNRSGRRRGDRRRHKDKSRSRSRDRDRDRDRHRSSRHHRTEHRSDRHERDRDRDRDRDRERERSDRDRDRDRDRDSRKRREHREEKSRHERSSRRHRSSSRGRDEERSSRKEKPPKAEPEPVRESRSRSRTPT